MKNLVVGRRTREAGFTLVELLVVVGIIVALAAVIIPNVASFSDKGELGGTRAEAMNVQNAMDNMMAYQGIASVTANEGGATAAVNDFTALPAECPLFGTDCDGDGNDDSALRGGTTVYYYCWDSSGWLTFQRAAAAENC